MLTLELIHNLVLAFGSKSYPGVPIVSLHTESNVVYIKSKSRIRGNPLIKPKKSVCKKSTKSDQHKFANAVRGTHHVNYLSFK